VLLRGYQREAVDSAWNSIRERQAHPLIVAPTGSGKSVIIAEIVRDAWERWQGRSIVLCHRKELIEQNAEKIRALLPGIEVGIYSAGLKRRDRKEPVIVAGIQSVYQSAYDLGQRHLCIVDECHLIAPHDGSRYQVFFRSLKTANPKLRLIGLTATPFRTGEGEVTEGGLLTEICYEASIGKLIDDGYLSPVVNRSGEQEVDLSQVGTRNGDYIPAQLEDAFLAGDLVSDAVRQIAEATESRRSVLVFCCGIRHAESVLDALKKITDSAMLIVGDTPPMLRASAIERFRSGELKYLVNVDVLTTGFDAPNTDAIAVLRATKSAGLFAQIVGRGFRIAAGKRDCLILDFGGNIERHGCLDDPLYGRLVKRREEQEAGEMPTKECPFCEATNPIAARTCEACGHVLVAESAPKHGDEADAKSALLRRDRKSEPFFATATVIRWNWSRHVGKNAKKDSLRLDFDCELDGEGDLRSLRVSKWLCPEHEGFARKKFTDSWQTMSLAPIPDTIDEAIDLWQRGAVLCPSRLMLSRRVNADPKQQYWDIATSEFSDDLPETWADEISADPFEEEDDQWDW
jgi:DNA repair protein RadD